MDPDNNEQHHEHSSSSSSCCSSSSSSSWDDVNEIHISSFDNNNKNNIGGDRQNSRREQQQKQQDEGSFYGGVIGSYNNDDEDQFNNDDIRNNNTNNHQNKNNNKANGVLAEDNNNRSMVVHRHQQQQNQQQPVQRQADTTAATTTTATNPATGIVPADRERELLLLMLLAQVCALEDVTPRTFTVHVLDWFERGILIDRRSMQFLYDAGLIPKPTQAAYPHPMVMNSTSTTRQHSSSSSSSSSFHERSMEVMAIRNALEGQEQQQQEMKLLTAGSGASSSKQDDNDDDDNDCGNDNGHNSKNTTSTTSLPAQEPTRPQQQQSILQRQRAWSVDEHPLRPSRYHREFEQIRLLSSGSFGHVYHVQSRMDRQDYAVKHVPFTSIGYTTNAVQHVVREVHCLAACDHPNIVRYYSSWLEPSWNTGSTTTTSTSTSGSGQLYNSSSSSSSSAASSSASFLQPSSDRIGRYLLEAEAPTAAEPPRAARRRRSSGSIDEDYSDIFDASEEYSEWTIDQSGGTTTTGHNKDEDSVAWRQQQQHQHQQQGNMALSSPKNRRTGQRQQQQKEQPKGYQYRISLYIQMQLCHPATLAEWIRERNNAHNNSQLQEHCKATKKMKIKSDDNHAATAVAGSALHHRVCVANRLFQQIVSGLRHVHSKNIIHRDLKPSNVFVSTLTTTTTNPPIKHQHHDHHYYNDNTTNGHHHHDNNNIGFQCKIGDFGLSKLLQATTPLSNNNSNKKKDAASAKAGLGLNHQQQKQQFLLEYDNKHDDSSNNSNNHSGSMTTHAHCSSAPVKQAPLSSLSLLSSEPLTARIGTASYAAPEQVSTTTYDTSVDVYSLGLILLELVCCFSTDHERLQTFHDCRQRRIIPKEITVMFPVAAKTILACTEPNPQKRPSANDLQDVNLLLSHVPPNQQQQQQQQQQQKKQQQHQQKEVAEHHHHQVGSDDDDHNNLDNHQHRKDKDKSGDTSSSSSKKKTKDDHDHDNVFIIQNLRKQLTERERELDECKNELKERERRIVELSLQLEEFQLSNCVMKKD